MSSETMKHLPPKEGERFLTASGWIVLTPAQAKALAEIRELAVQHGLLQYLEGQGWSAPGVSW